MSHAQPRLLATRHCFPSCPRAPLRRSSASGVYPDFCRGIPDGFTGPTGAEGSAFSSTTRYLAAAWGS